MLSWLSRSPSRTDHLPTKYAKHTALWAIRSPTTLPRCLSSVLDITLLSLDVVSAFPCRRSVSCSSNPFLTTDGRDQLSRLHVHLASFPSPFLGRSKWLRSYVIQLSISCSVLYARRRTSYSSSLASLVDSLSAFRYPSRFSFLL